MPVYPVTDTPKFITGVNSAGYVLKNSGTETVYIGQDSSLTVVSRSFSLSPGSVFSWPGNSTEIWAVTDPGITSEIEILYDSNASFTPGPDTVAATQRMRYTVITDQSIPSIPAFTDTDCGTFDVASYPSIRLNFVCGAGTASIRAMRIFLEWYDGAFLVYREQIGVGAVPDAVTEFFATVRGPRLKIVVSNSQGVGFTDSPLRIDGISVAVQERYRTLSTYTSADATVLTQDPGVWGDYFGMVIEVLPANPSGNRNLRMLPTIAGPARFGMSVNTASATMRPGFIGPVPYTGSSTTAPSVTQSQLARIIPTVSGDDMFQFVDFIIPRRPITFVAGRDPAAGNSYVYNMNLAMGIQT